MSRRREAALSLGSNLGERRAYLGWALRQLEGRILEKMEVSSLWESEPVEVAGEQPPFLNLCAVGKTALTPTQLLERCQALEREAGREAGAHGLPRVLDLDLLYHGRERRADETLRLPHPGMARRRFVLAPLAELRPHWRHPESRRSVRELLTGLGDEQDARIVETEAGWWHDA